jgi:hypothetical protein
MTKDMLRLDRIASAVSDFTLGTAIVLAHVVLAERTRAREQRQLERGTEPIAPRRASRSGRGGSHPVP